MTNEGPLQKHYFGRFLAAGEFLEFPRESLRDSWEVGVWRADQWTWTGKPISSTGFNRFWQVFRIQL
ncbi:hypothetical protein, partial [Mesorhizobium sp. LSJC264A00]|uniref:hypothetical protein n=1 Tax=Mesorhizobium sp. LSJC264A00 TaxID=1287321 RepID=UPI000518C9F9